jgi:hypothetical protein
MSSGGIASHRSMLVRSLPIVIGAMGFVGWETLEAEPNSPQARLEKIKITAGRWIRDIFFIFCISFERQPS